MSVSHSFIKKQYNNKDDSKDKDIIFNDIEMNESNHNMTASYSEIAYNSTNIPSMSTSKNMKFPIQRENLQSDSDENDVEDDDISICDVNVKNIVKNNYLSGPQQRPISLVCDNLFPYNLEGTVSKDGNMTHFVAENLEYKIKLSSPVNKKDYQSSLSKNSTPSTSGLITKQFLLPQQLPQIDSNVLNDIEIESQYLAASVDNLTENLCNLLHSISSITADNVEIHKNAVNKLTDSMDANIKSMYTIMAKTEEITKSMKPTEQLSQRIREIKRLVDMLENNL